MNPLPFQCIETLGAAYPRTLIRLPMGGTRAATCRVLVDGVPVPSVVPADDAASVFFPLSLSPYQKRTIVLEPGAEPAPPPERPLVSVSADGIRLRPPAFGAADAEHAPPAAEFRLPPPGRTEWPHGTAEAPAPILSILPHPGSNTGNALARGFLDTGKTRVTALTVTLAEAGPLLTRVRLDYELEDAQRIVFEVSASVCEPFLRIMERTTRPSALFRARHLLVMDAEPAPAHAPACGLPPEGPLGVPAPDAPAHALHTAPDGASGLRAEPRLGWCDLADHTLFLQPRPCRVTHDALVARLYPWTQGSQIARLREGVQYTPPGSDLTLAWFVLEPDAWNGFKRNFIEFHERNLPGGDALRRGGEDPDETWAFLPQDLRALGQTSGFRACFTAESVLAGDTRCYALGVGAAARFRPPEPVPEHTLEWYEGPARLAEWSAARAPLRAAIQTWGLAPIRFRDAPPLEAPRWLEPGTAPAAPAASALLPPPGHLPPQHIALTAAFPAPVQRALAHLDRPEAAQLALTCLRDKLAVLAGGYVAARGPGGTNPVTLRVVYPLAILFQALLHGGGGALPAHLPDEPADLPPLTARLADAFFFLADLCARPWFYPGERTMLPWTDEVSSEPTCLGMPNMNFFTDVYCLCGGLALRFPCHARATAWLARANAMLRMQLQRFSDPRSGIWEESHTYYHHVLRTLALFTLEQQCRARAGDARCTDWFGDAAFRRLCAAALRMVTPRDPRHGNRRMLPTLGDHRAELGWHTYAALAIGFEPHDPAFAAALSWLSVENGWTGNCPVAPATEVPRAFVPAGFSSLDGLGGLVRHCHANATESLLLLRAGYTWGHHNCDELECLCWIADEPLFVEAGYGMPKTFEKIGASGHSTLHPAHGRPAFYLGRANRGCLTAWAASPDGSKATLRAGCVHTAQLPPGADTLTPVPVFPWRQERTVALHIDETAGCATLVITDEWTGDEPQLLVWHTGLRTVRRNRADAPGVVQLRGAHLEARLETTPPLDFRIQKDASGLTVGLTAPVPRPCHRVVTRVLITLQPHRAPHRRPT